MDQAREKLKAEESVVQAGQVALKMEKLTLTLTRTVTLTLTLTLTLTFLTLTLTHS